MYPIVYKQRYKGLGFRVLFGRVLGVQGLTLFVMKTARFASYVQTEQFEL